MGINWVALKHYAISLFVILFISLLISGCGSLTEEEKHQELISYLVEQSVSNEYIEELKLNERFKNDNGRLAAIMSDSFYENDLKKQYDIIAEVFDGYISKTHKLKNYNSDAEMRIGKDANKYYVYWITEKSFNWQVFYFPLPDHF